MIETVKTMGIDLYCKLWGLIGSSTAGLGKVSNVKNSPAFFFIGLILGKVLLT